MYDPKNDRQPTADDALYGDELLEDQAVEAKSAAAKVQPKNTELAALEQTVQKASKQGGFGRFFAPQKNNSTVKKRVRPLSHSRCN